MNSLKELIASAGLTGEALSKELKASLDNGLSLVEARQRWHRNGPNSLPSGHYDSLLIIVARQFVNPLILLLIIAAFISISIGHLKDSIFILIALLINAAIGAYQEYQASKIVASLAKLAGPTTQVKRNGRLQVIPATELVVGDLVIITSGSQIPADIRLISSAGLEIDESTLTGESLPVEKTDHPINNAGKISDLKNIIFMGTHAVRGRAEGLVVATGLQTQIGIINETINEAKAPLSPLQTQIADFTKKTAYLISSITLIVFFVGLLIGQPLQETALSVISLAVAAIPEGLPVLVTVILAIGMKKMAEEKALVKKLSAVETVGQTQILLTDKTGTLTLNSMSVAAISLITNRGWANYSLDSVQKNITGLLELATCSVLCNDRHVSNHESYYDPVDKALWDFFKKFINVDQIIKKQPRIYELPFNSEQKMAVSFNKQSGGNLIAYVKGSPKKVAEISQSLAIDGRIVNFTAIKKKEWNRHIKRISSGGEKLIATAQLIISKDDFNNANRDTNKLWQLIKGKAILTGLIALSDPLRPNVDQIIQEANNAQVEVVMATGDLKPIAQTVARSINIKPENVYAEITPVNKLDLVKKYQSQNLTVAMTGDGVNDAPALKQADIGLAMGLRGTDIAKSAADIVILDDSIGTIITAIRSGRTIFRNIQRVVLYFIATNIAEVFIVASSVITAGLIPLPLLPVHILWVNLITDSLTVLPLAFEPDHDDAMRQPPRKRKDPLLPDYFWRMAVVINVVLVSLTLSSFLVALNLSNSLFYAQSIAFATLAFAQIFNLLNMRSVKSSLFKLGILSNPSTIISIIGSTLLQVLIFFIPLTQQYVSLAAVPTNVLLILIAYSSLSFWLVELYKYLSTANRK